MTSLDECFEGYECMLNLMTEVAKNRRGKMWRSKKERVKVFSAYILMLFIMVQCRLNL